MLNKIISILKVPSKLILIIGSFVYALLFAVVSFANAGGGFFPTITAIIIATTGSIALIVVPIFLLLKKENVSKIAFTILAGYWIISSLLSNISNGYYIDTADNTVEGLFVTASVFSFIFGIVLLAAIILFVLSIALKKDILKVISFFICLGVVLFAMLVGIFWFIYYGNVQAEYGANFVRWDNYFDIVMRYYIAPILVLEGAVYFYL